MSGNHGMSQALHSVAPRCPKAKELVAIKAKRAWWPSVYRVLTCNRLHKATGNNYHGRLLLRLPMTFLFCARVHSCSCGHALLVHAQAEAHEATAMWQA